VKFTEKGGVSLSVTVERQTDDEAALRFSVHDTGIGISEEARARLFNPFSQADATITRKYGGTGLGLAICRRIVDLMGGSIGLESRPGEGSTFWFSLLMEKPAGGPPVAAKGGGVLAGARVLALIQSEIQKAALVEQLSGWGMKAEVATGEEEAVAMARNAATGKVSYAFAVLGVQGSGGEGLKLARQMMNDPALSGISLVLLAGLHHRPARAELETLPRTVCLSLPLKPRLLREALIFLATGTGASPAKQSGPPLSVGPARVGQVVKILVAEDNPVNQKVTILQLRRLGFEADIAKNGQEALTKWREGAHPLILMDCQMPELDGYEVTRRIREIEKASGAVPVKIIAMTASAVEGDREICLQNQMDDYIPKPVVLSRLKETLERNLAPPAKEGP
jgi:CheY-like chemotaxis protein